MAATGREQFEDEEDDTEQFLASMGTAADSSSAVKLPVDPAKVAPEAAATSTPPVDSPAEVARLKAQLAEADHKVKTLQGIANKHETARLREELDALKAQMAPKPAPEPEPTPAMSDEDYQALVTEVGEKAAKVQKKALEESGQHGSKLAKLEAEMAALKGETKAVGEKAGHLEQAQAQTAEARFFASLDSIAPEWKKINGWEEDGIQQDPKFTEFAFKNIPGTDFTYQDALLAYQDARNAAKVAEIFNLFKKSVGAETPAAEPGGEEMTAEPTRSGGGTPPPAAQTTKKTFTQDEVDRFDSLYHNNKLKGDPGKIEAMWDEIQLAIYEGRVR